tara:strand:- start:185 stop:382 length:198 start_codon:yes stop_codon:yes gene_type:complete
MDKFASLYYQLRSNPVDKHRYAALNIGTMDYGAWLQSVGGNLQLDNAENNQTTESITNDIMEQMK